MAGKTTSIRGAPVTLLCAILTFVVIQIALVGLIRSWNPQPAYDPEYAHKLVKLREHLSHRDDTGKLLLVLGSSRVATGFHPEILPAMQTAGLPKLHIFNFGICQWVHPVTQSIVLHRVLREGIRPDYVLFEIFPAVVSAGPEQARNLNLTRLDSHDLEVARPYTAKWLRQRLDWMEMQWIPAFSERFLMLSRYAPKWVERNNTINFNWTNLGDWGWTCLPHFNANYEIDGEKKHFEGPLKTAFMSETSQRIYEDMFELCRRSNIAAGVVLMPEHEQFRELYSPLSAARLQTALKDFENRLGVSVIDARDWMPDDAFVEGVHLTHSGSAAFTQRFQNTFQPMLVSDHSKGADGGK